MKQCLIACLLMMTCVQLFAQEYYLPLNREWSLRYEPALNTLNSNAHTSIKPYRNTQINAISNFDSLNTYKLKQTKFNKTLAGKKLRSENLFIIKEDDYEILLDPLFNFSLGKESDVENNYITNTRGFWLSGYIGERFSFSSTLTENQMEFPQYIDSTVQYSKVAPGIGRVKNFKRGGYDFSNASGTISYSLKKYFNFRFGNDKNFIGDGYRSLLLSDNAYNYTFFKINTSIWKINYTNLYMFMQELKRPLPAQRLFKRKYASLHYLDVNIGRRLSIGVMENVIWSNDTLDNRGFDLNYLNPIIFFRPLEYSLGSPDNIILGANVKYKVSNNTSVYGQLLVDEFRIDEFRSNNKWWGNKFGYQLGVKAYDVLNIDNLHLLSELNVVRPYTYSHFSSFQNYAHYNQSLAHPLGSNFWEWITITNYRYNRILLEGKFMYAKIGYDSDGVNYGQNIFLSYDTRPRDYDVELLQGLETTIVFIGFKTAYLINPKTNMRVELEINSRNSENEKITTNDLIFSFGIKALLHNTYHDF